MNMIEKVAKAIYEFDEAKDTWEDAGKSSKLANIRLAKIIIEAMREPTEEMLNGARDWSAIFIGTPVGNKAAIGCFQSMIDAALKD